MITYRPLASRAGGSGPAYDDSAIRERLDTLEANRSASPAFRPELRSRVGGLTLASSVDLLVPVRGYITLRLRSASGDVFLDVYGGSLQQVVDDLAAYDPSGAFEGLVDEGHFVLRPADPTASLHVTSSDPDGVLEAFDIDETWFGQDVYPRPAGTYDTTSGAVRLTGPAGAYAPGSGLSVSTALEALKRLHHASDTIVEDRDFWSFPDGLDPETVTLGQIGAELGQTAALSWASQENVGVEGDPIMVTDLDETVIAFVQRIPLVAGVSAQTNGPGRTVLAFFTDGDFWHLQHPIPDGFGGVRIVGSTPITGRIRRVLARSHSDDVFVSTSFSIPDSQFNEFVSGQLSTVLGTMLTELRWLRKRVATLETLP